MAHTSFSDKEWDTLYDLKRKGLEDVLGEMHNTVGHSIIGFEFGGLLDMYYFPKHMQGTGLATMELIQPEGGGSIPNELGTYELLAFTKYPFEEKSAMGSFLEAEQRICSSLTKIGQFSFETELNPKDSFEIPQEEGQSSYFILDNYIPGSKEFFIGTRKHHLLLCIEVFKSELEFALETSSDKLLDTLKQKGVYPYSDLDRQPVM